MVQNRNKLIDLFIGNISNSVIHQILEKAINKEMSSKYRKELITSLEIAKKYRQKVNPINSPLPHKDISYIRKKIVNKVRAELLIRIVKGYKNINLDLVDQLVDKLLKDTNVI